jgi:protein-S-isoprenylcysteine O-methyltransferase Ste14
MIADINLFGVFVDVALVTALVAAAALAILHRVLAATGAYRWVWHPPLFNLALFAVLWLASAVAATHFQDYLANLLG